MTLNNYYWNDISDVITTIADVTQLKGKSILITGATGMVCSPVVDILFELNSLGYGTKIYIAGRNSERVKERFGNRIEGRDYRFIEFDATKSAILDLEVDYIIYGASNANPAMFATQPVETALANLFGLNSCLELARKNKGCRLLYVSSSEIYGIVNGGGPYKENQYGTVDILNSRACYPSSKRMAETLCASYGAEYGVEVVIVRLGHIYGPTITESDNRATAQFTRNVLEKKDIVMKSAGDQLRSYCYVLDCASAILAVLLNGKNNEAYNISNRDSIVSIRSIAEKMAEYMNVDIVFENPSDLEKKGYNLMDNSSLNSDKLEGLGWKARFSLKEGVEHMFESLKA